MMFIRDWKGHLSFFIVLIKSLRNLAQNTKVQPNLTLAGKYYNTYYIT